MREIARGAEAVIFEKGNSIIKERLSKAYRIKELDDELRSQRTKRETALLGKVPVAHPKLIESDGKGRIVMERIDGVKLREVLDSKPELAKEVGEMVGRLHNKGIIHGDLTTSNLIFDKSSQLVLIDFGLSFHSEKTEDKAVDIHLFKEALNSKHHKVHDEAWRGFLLGYTATEGYKDILARLKQVEQRGRYRKG